MVRVVRQFFVAVAFLFSVTGFAQEPAQAVPVPVPVEDDPVPTPAVVTDDPAPAPAASSTHPGTVDTNNLVDGDHGTIVLDGSDGWASYGVTVSATSQYPHIAMKLGGTGNSDRFSVFSSAGIGSPLFTVRGDGKVGIGVTPTARLHAYSSQDSVMSLLAHTATTVEAATSQTDFGALIYGHQNVAAGVSASSTIYGTRSVGYQTGAGTLVRSYGLSVDSGVDAAATGTVTNGFGIRVGVHKGGGTVTNSYGLWIENLEGSNTSTAVYQEGADDKNFFGGDVGIGVYPTRKLDVSGDARVIGTTLLNISSPLASGDAAIVGSSIGIQRFGGVTAAPSVTFSAARGSEGNAAMSVQGDETGRLLFRGWDGTAGISSARIGAIIDGPVTSSPSSVPQAITFKTGNTAAPAERMRIDSNGNVSMANNLAVTGSVSVGALTMTPTIATVNGVPANRLVINGELQATRVVGAVYQDIAEWVPATTDLVPGTVVILNPTKTNEVMASQTAYDTTVAGVVSAEPGVILGVEGIEKEQIATTGRVKVRVDARNAAIRVGDLLVTSDIAGTAMKSEPMEINGRRFHQPGTILGKALEPLESGMGEILVLLSMQ